MTPTPQSNSIILCPTLLNSFFPTLRGSLHLLFRSSDFPCISFSSLSLPKSPIPRISPQTPIPPSETCRKVIHKSLMMEIMMIRSSPKWDEFIQ